MTPNARIELRTHWWKGSALTTVPTLLPQRLVLVKKIFWIKVYFKENMALCNLKKLIFVVKSSQVKSSHLYLGRVTLSALGWYQ